MRDLSECKIEIRRQIREKENRRFTLHKRWIKSLSICAAVLICICVASVVSRSINNKKTIYISNYDLGKYDSFEEIVNDSDLIFIGTVQSEHFVLENQSSPETIKTEYSFEIESCIIGDFDNNTIIVTTKGGTTNNVKYVLKGSEQYVIGERYIVFLSKQISESAVAAFHDQYVETSPLMGKIRIKEGEIVTNANEWKKVDDFSSVKNVDELIHLIQRIKNTLSNSVSGMSGLESLEVSNQIDDSLINNCEESISFGEFGEYKIHFLAGQCCVMTKKEVAGYSFIYGSSFTISVENDQEEYDLNEAFEEGVLTKDDIAKIYEIYKDYFRQYYTE